MYTLTVRLVSLRVENWLKDQFSKLIVLYELMNERVVVLWLGGKNSCVAAYLCGSSVRWPVLKNWAYLYRI